MAIVVETVNRKGRVIYSKYFAKNTVTIGRSYDNDYVIDDHYVDAEHLMVSVDEEGVYTCIDKDSVNGLATVKGKPLSSPHIINDGETILLGKTLLRIAATRTAVLPARKLSFVENAGEYLATIPAAIASSLILILLVVNNIHLNAHVVEDEVVDTVLYIITGAIVMSFVATFIGRLLRNDQRFLLYFNLINCALILSYCYGVISPAIAFNFNFLQFDNGIDEIIYALIFSFLLYFLFRFATRLRNKSLFIITAIAPALILIDVLLPSDEVDHFKFTPPYDALVRHESIYWGNKLEHDEYLKAAQSLYKPSFENQE